ncbi:MAG: hypothetical protein RBR86_08335 [Pseudobdellovibrionaceae bacterium]|jgi:hypothetical protein|nr:hypothetical protein [Pseudobdellovibrionaceae bacterium]
MSSLKRFLTYCLYLGGWKRAEKPHVPTSTSDNEPEKPLIGTNGPIVADMLVMKRDDRIVLVVDHEFQDIPEWVEWDVSRNIIGIVQMGGAVAELNSVIPPEKVDMFRNAKNLALAIRFDGRDVVHGVYLVVRD